MLTTCPPRESTEMLDWMVFKADNHLRRGRSPARRSFPYQARTTLAFSAPHSVRRAMVNR